MTHFLISQFAPHIAALPDRAVLVKSDLLVPNFLLHKEGDLEIFYAPLDDVNEKAKIVIIGITPGWTQMEISYRAARQALQQGLSLSKVCAQAKRQASFAGSMRKNLITMLDGVEIPEALGIASSELLFSERRELLHTTSTVRYPVFVSRQNYTGHKPRLLKMPVLCEYVYGVLVPELRLLNRALLVPLGKSVSAVLQALIEADVLDSRRCLLDFPHPSGANAHRESQFDRLQPEFKRVVKDWYGAASM